MVAGALDRMEMTGMEVHVKALSLTTAILQLIASVDHVDSWKPISQEDLKLQSAVVAIRCSALASLVWRMYDTPSMRQKVSDYAQKEAEIGTQVTRLASYGIATLKETGGVQMMDNIKQTGASEPPLQGFLALQSDEFVWGTVFAGMYNGQYREIDPLIPTKLANDEDRTIATGRAAQAEFDKRNCSRVGR